MKIGISTRIQGNKPQELIELLQFENNESILKLVTYNKSNGYVKVFTYADFIEWYCFDRQTDCLNLSFDDYGNDDCLVNLIYEWQYGDK